MRERYQVAAPVTGIVRRIELEPGDPVVAGKTVLATIQPAQPVPLDARSRAEANARVAAARSALDGAEAERASARAADAETERELARTRSLEQAGALPRRDLENAETAAQQAGQAVAAADAAVGSARQQLQAARAALIGPSGESDTTAVALRSPVDGVVLKRLRESATPVAAGEPLLEVADLADLEVVADFLSSDAVAMRPGMPVRLEQWGGERVLHGRVRRVEPSAFTKVSALGVEEQRVNVVVAAVDPAEWRGLGDGFRVEVAVIVWSGSDVLQIPTGALFRAGDGWRVYVDRDGKARAQEVVPGHRDDFDTEIVSGLQAGDRVVVNPGDEVQDGTRIAAD